MHRAEVLVILGIPGDYRTRPCLYAEILGPTPYYRQHWMTNSCVIYVYTNQQERVVQAEYYKSLKPKRTD
jgi:hypothetical protein